MLVEEIDGGGHPRFIALVIQVYGLYSQTLLQLRMCWVSRHPCAQHTECDPGKITLWMPHSQCGAGACQKNEEAGVTPSKSFCCWLKYSFQSAEKGRAVELNRRGRFTNGKRGDLKTRTDSSVTARPSRPHQEHCACLTTALHKASVSLHFTDGKTKARRCKALCSSACKTPYAGKRALLRKNNIKILFIVYVLHLFKGLYSCWNMIGNHEIKVGNNILPPLGTYEMPE